MGLMMEMLFGKSRCLGEDTIGAFNSNFWTPQDLKSNMKRMEEVMSDFGLQSGGKDVMFCGKTGQKLRCSVFNGVGYLRVLNHFSNKKVRARERGPVCDLTRQTTVGKQNNGGQKIGEMMNWNFYSYGASETARSMNYESADTFETHWCDTCNWFAVGNDKTGAYYCPSCNQNVQSTASSALERGIKKIKLGA
jgi:DNA-directed RNA polymerase beta subunit